MKKNLVLIKVYVLFLKKRSFRRVEIVSSSILTYKTIQYLSVITTILLTSLRADSVALATVKQTEKYYIPSFDYKYNISANDEMSFSRVLIEPNVLQLSTAFKFMNQ